MSKINKMPKIKALVNTLAATFAIAFFDEVFKLNVSPEVYVVLGCVDVVVIGYLLVLVNKK